MAKKENRGGARAGSGRKSCKELGVEKKQGKNYKLSQAHIEYIDARSIEPGVSKTSFIEGLIQSDIESPTELIFPDDPDSPKKSRRYKLSAEHRGHIESRAKGLGVPMTKIIEGLIQADIDKV